MNIQARNYDARRNRRKSKDALSLGTKLGMISYTLFLFVFAFGIVNYTISLKQKLNDIRLETNRVKNELKDLTQDIKALQLEKERLSSWSNIRAKIERYDLKLRAPEPAQIRRFAITRRTDINGRSIALAVPEEDSNTGRSRFASTQMR